MKKPIRDNWYTYMIKETLQKIMKLAYRNAKKSIRNALDTFHHPLYY
ncbi:hypothetical protein IGI49_000017 [Enterococcus sp. AZ071]